MRNVVSILKAEEIAAEAHDLWAAMFVEKMRMTALGPCVRCGRVAGQGAGWHLTRAHCNRLGIEYGDGPNGPLVIMPFCKACEAAVGRDPVANAEMEEICMKLAETGYAELDGVTRKV